MKSYTIIYNTLHTIVKSTSHKDYNIDTFITC